MSVQRRPSLSEVIRAAEVVSVRDKHQQQRRKTAFILPACFQCGTSKMSSIPMGAHAAFKVRDNMNGSGEQNGKQFQPAMGFSNADAGQPTVPPPERYTSKLMNSVWGMYNRYSVHNIKSQIALEKN